MNVIHGVDRYRNGVKWVHERIIQRYLYNSSLYRNNDLSFGSFSYNGIFYDVLKVSFSDVIVGQKGSNGDRKLPFFGRD